MTHSIKRLRARGLARAGAIAAAAALALVTPARAHAQNLGPFRQFLSINPYYSYEKVDLGAGQSRVGVNGYGARLWINTAPFGLTDHLGAGVFYTRTPQPSNGVSLTHYGAQFDVFPAHRPAGGFFDPFVSVGAGAFHLAAAGQTSTHFSLVPGIGLRIPIPNRLELRTELRDAIVFGSTVGVAPGDHRTTNNLEAQAGIGLTF